jgi:hypothetical protein
MNVSAACDTLQAIAMIDPSEWSDSIQRSIAVPKIQCDRASSPETQGYTDVAGRANKKSEKYVFVRRKEKASAARLAPYAMIDAVGL